MGNVVKFIRSNDSRKSSKIMVSGCSGLSICMLKSPSMIRYQ